MPADEMLLSELYMPCSRKSTCAHALLLLSCCRVPLSAFGIYLHDDCCFHVVGSLKVWWSTSQKSVASASMHSERGMFIGEHRSVVVCCVCSVAESVCLSWVVMLCACEQVVDVELGSGVPHISNLQALASPSPTIWPQALFDLDFTGNMSIRTQNTGGGVLQLFCSLLSFLGPNMSCLPFTLGLFHYACYVPTMHKSVYSRWQKPRCSQSTRGSLRWHETRVSSFEACMRA